MNHVTGAVRLFFVALYILLVVFFVLAVFPFCSAVQRGRWIHRLAGWVPAICGVRMTVKGRVPDQGACETGIHSGGTGYMVCANHVSFLDIFVLDAVLPSRFVAKKEIASWPVFGMISRGVGTLFIDRSRRRAVLEVAELMSSTMKKGENVLFFPEGTTGKGDVLLPFYANLFTAGPMAEAEILPVTLRYTLKGETTTVTSYAHESLFTVLRRIVSTSGLGVEVTVIDPIPSAGRERRELCALASARMAEALGVPDATAAKEAQRRARLEAATASRAEA